MKEFKEIGSKMDGSILKGVSQCSCNDGIVEVITEIKLKNDYVLHEQCQVNLKDFVDENSAKSHCEQVNKSNLIIRLDEIYDYMLFLNNQGITFINDKQWDEYVKLKIKEKSNNEQMED